MMAISLRPRQVRVVFQVQRRETIGQAMMTELVLLLTGVQALEAAVGPNLQEMVRGVSETIRQHLVVILLEAVR